MIQPDGSRGRVCKDIYNQTQMRIMHHNYNNIIQTLSLVGTVLSSQSVSLVVIEE